MTTSALEFESLARANLRERSKQAGQPHQDQDSGTASLVTVPEEYSDDALALAFTDRYKGTLRYTAAWSKWHERDATSRWREDTTLHVFERARALPRSGCGHQVIEDQARCGERAHCRQRREARALRS